MSTVLHVTSLPGGGVDRHVRDIVRATRRRHVVWHVSGSGADVLETFEPRRFHALAPRWGETHGDALAKWLREQGVGVVHAHSVTRMPRHRAAWAARALGAPLIATLHDVLFLREDALDPAAPRAPDPAWMAQAAAFLEKAAARVAPSEYLAGIARTHLPHLEIQVVPNGSPRRRPPLVAPRARLEFLERRPRRVAIVLGAIGPHKGARILEEAGERLAAAGLGIVVLGYLDAQNGPGWRNPGLFVHGAYDDEAVPGLVAVYGGELAVFPNQVPESFSYALSDLWEAGLPALVPPEGALGERVREHGGGWLLPPAFGAAEVAAEIERLLSPAGAEDLATVKSSLSIRDARRVPALQAMAASLDALYERYGLRVDGGVNPAAAPMQELLATQLDGSLFRPELVRASDELAQLRAAAAHSEAESRRWIAKLEADVQALKADLTAEVEERRRLAEENARLHEHRAALESLPALLRRLLLRRVRGARR